jgi:hypothetical protein
MFYQKWSKPGPYLLEFPLQLLSALRAARVAFSATRSQPLWNPPDLLFNRRQRFFPWGYSGLSVKLISHIHILLRPGMLVSYVPTLVLFMVFVLRSSARFFISFIFMPEETMY